MIPSKRNLPVLGAALVLLLAIGEWALRIRHRQSELNEPAEGLRAETRQINPDALLESIRIVALGDSITHGMELPTEETYPYQLEQQLQAHLNGRPLVVINVGIAGQTAVQGLHRLRRDVFRYKPHITLIGFGLNDASLCRRPQDEQREQEAFPSGLGAILNHSHLYRSLKVRVRRFASPLGLYEPIDYDATPANEPRSSPDMYRAALEKMVEQIRRCDGGEVLLLTTHPVVSPPEEMCGHALDIDRQPQVRIWYNDIVRSVANELDVGLVDIERAFHENGEEQFIQPDGLHLTKAGQQLLAQCAYESIIERGLLDIR